MAVVAPLAVLMGNDVERVAVDGVDLHITTSERPQTATLERAWLDAPTVRPGSTVPLKVLLRTYRGEEVVRTVPIEIPANAQRVAVGARVRWRQARPDGTARHPDRAAAERSTR